MSEHDNRHAGTDEWIACRTCNPYPQYVIALDRGRGEQDVVKVVEVVAQTGGLAGATGPQGDTGPQGEPGEQGPPGETGAEGPQGVPGSVGPEGPQGATGPTGADGVQGPQGIKGDKGDKGDPGDEGPQGEPGATGAQGIPGTPGEDGEPGAGGAGGAQGPPGTTGANGANGATILTGSGTPSGGANGDYYLRSNGDWYGPKAAGAWGSPIANLTGPQGIQGTQGTQGVQGVQGVQGNAGSNGTNGTNGTNWTPVHTVLADDTLAMALGTNTSVRLTVTANRTLTTTVPAAGSTRRILILTSGVTSRTITFGSGFKPVGTLATGTTSARVFVINWISDGTNLYEAGRTAAMVA